MTLKKNEFLVGCLLGGILGAATGLLVQKKIVNGATHTFSKGKKKTSPKTHASTPHDSNDLDHKVHKTRKRKASPKRLSTN